MVCRKLSENEKLKEVMRKIRQSETNNSKYWNKSSSSTENNPKKEKKEENETA